MGGEILQHKLQQTWELSSKVSFVQRHPPKYMSQRQTIMSISDFK